MSEILAAANERAVRELVAAIRDAFHPSTSGSEDFGPFTASYAAAFHLEGGTVDLNGDGTVSISELDVKWDVLAVALGIDLPGFCIGGWCIIPTPFGCALRFPKICVFDDDPDIGIDLDLSGLLTSELSVRAHPVVRYWVDPARPPGLDDVDAHRTGVADEWQVLLEIDTVDIDLFDLADIVGDLLEQAVDAAIDAIFSGYASWIGDILKAIVGPVIDLIRDILDIPDDIQEWLSNLLGVSLGLLDALVTAVANGLLADRPLVHIENPFPLPPDTALIPVSLPIETFDVQITDDELIVRAAVGA